MYINKDIKISIIIHNNYKSDFSKKKKKKKQIADHV